MARREWLTSLCVHFVPISPDICSKLSIVQLSQVTFVYKKDSPLHASYQKSLDDNQLRLLSYCPSCKRPADVLIIRIGKRGCHHRKDGIFSILLTYGWSKLVCQDSGHVCERNLQNPPIHTSRPRILISKPMTLGQCSLICAHETVVLCHKKNWKWPK